MSRTILVLAIATLLGAAPAMAAEAQIHSGTLTAIDRATGTLTLEEMGRWTGPGSGVISRSIGVTPATRLDLLRRSTKAAGGGWPGGYVESPLTLAGFHPGDFATVTVKAHGRALTAVSVDVVRAPAH